MDWGSMDGMMAAYSRRAGFSPGLWFYTSGAGSVTDPVRDTMYAYNRRVEEQVLHAVSAGDSYTWGGP